MLEQYGYHGNKTIREYQDMIYTLKRQYFHGDLKYDNKLRTLRALVQEKLKNMVKDLHYKTANAMCHNYGTIILPHYGTQSMMRSKTISTYTKKETLALAHAAFRRCLISKAELKACVLLIPRNETGTTKTCGVCFSENNEVGGSEVFHCPQCQLIAGRDVNAPRNIFLRQLQF